MRSLAVLSATTAMLAVAVTPAAAQSCGDMKPHGITDLRASGVGCSGAAHVARNHSYERGTRGWSCAGRRASATVERVRCRKGDRRVTFRSTYVMELPAAPAPPSVGGGR